MPDTLEFTHECAADGSPQDLLGVDISATASRIPSLPSPTTAGDTHGDHGIQERELAHVDEVEGTPGGDSGAD